MSTDYAPGTGEVFWEFAPDESFTGYWKWQVVEGGSWPIRLESIPPHDSVLPRQMRIGSEENLNLTFREEDEVPKQYRY